jgi:hypothetical protein
MKTYRPTLPEISKLVDFCALFIALSSVVFADSQSKISTILSDACPENYRNRKSYINRLWSAIAFRALPAIIFMGAYVFSLAGTALSIYQRSNFSFDVYRVDPLISLFMITYALPVCMLFVSAVSIVRLIGKLAAAGHGREGRPRVTALI